MERALGNIYISNPLYRPCSCQSRASSGGRGSKWLLAHTLTPKEPPVLTLRLWVWNSLWWLFYQRSCPSPGRLGPKEDDPHFLKAKCSVLISRNEQPVTWVNLLDLVRFIVSCHSWTHRTDLYRPVLPHAACVATHRFVHAHTRTHTTANAYCSNYSPAHCLTRKRKSEIDTLANRWTK